MALSPGATVGHYQIVGSLGAGGMGEVYRARDSKLNRDVALKILPDVFALDGDRIARFRREAQVLAALNHPNIAAIYGFEDSGSTHALVLELVEGPTLADRIAEGPIPLDDALPIAKQIAEALEAAHEHGIIHRDLKPANIKVRQDGAVKVLDFGLARAMDLRPSLSTAAALADSPTITNAGAMTASGVILGTAAYMSPEQARGKVVDKRTDLWAFGCLLYEMLTGLALFGGDNVTDTIAAVVRADPDWGRLPANTPAAIRRLLRRCLEKERVRRLADAADARLELDEALHRSAGDAYADPVGQPASRAAHTGWERALPWVSTGVLAAVLAVAFVLWAPWRVVPPTRVTRTTVATPESATPSINGVDGHLALSPDGANVVFVGNGGTQLFVRALDTLEPRPIFSGRFLRGPFVSPDSQWVGFSSDNNALMKVRMAGGPPIKLTTIDGTPRGATWAPDNTIIFATGHPATGLQRVSAEGGTPAVLTRPDPAQDEGDHVWPEILPGGGAVLFTITSRAGGLDKAQIAVRDLRTGTHNMLLRGGSHARYVASGHLVYVAAGTLRAIPFDLNRLETHGTAVPVVPRLVTTNSGTAECAVATDGTLIYMDTPGLLAANDHTLIWVDRKGNEQPISAPPRGYQHPRLSPVGKRVALWIRDQEDDIWVWGTGQAPFTKLTDDPGMDRFPVWTRDGQRIVFTSNRGGALNLWWQAADGSGEAERLTTSSNSQFPTGITPDDHVVFFEATPTAGSDLLQVALGGTHQVKPLLQTKYDERNGVVSRDGRWLAFDSNRSGSFEVYVQPFPDGGSQRVSTAGGTRPMWADNGKELFYVGADTSAELSVWQVPVQVSGATWNAGAPAKLFGGHYYSAGTSGRTYDVSPDGQQFLMIKAGTGGGLASSAVIVVQHWDEELKRLVPTK